MKIGMVNRLKINRDSEFGLYVGDSVDNEVLLPKRYVEDQMQIGQMIDLFVYLDSEDRPVATTERPTAMLGEYAYCEVVSTAPFGAFVDWGLPKDLFIPFAHQKNRLKVGDKVVLQVQSDPKTQRLIGSTKFEYISSKRPTNLKKNNQLDLLVYAKTPMGFKVIANNLYDGMIFHNEIFESVSIGDKKVGFVKNVRKDGKLDISLRPIGKKSDDDQKILTLLQEADGFLPYNYKSDPQALIDTFGMSKKAFKKALTSLLESGKITVLDNGIALHK